MAATAETIGSANVTDTSFVAAARAKDRTETVYTYIEYGKSTNDTSTEYDKIVWTWDPDPYEYALDLTGLDSGTTYYYRALLLDGVGGNVIDTGAWKTETTDSAPPEVDPEVTTKAATNVGDTSADLNATIDSMGSHDEVYGDHMLDGPDGIEAVEGSKETSAGNYTNTVTGLYPDTQYRFYAQLMDMDGNFYTDGSLYFTTTGGIDSPTAQTNPLSSKSETSATLEGTVDDDGGESCSVWFRWKKSSDSSWSSTSSNSGYYTNDDFNDTLSGLTEGESYDYRAVVSNSAGTDYGNIRSFTTDSATPVGDAGYMWVQSINLRYLDSTGVMRVLSLEDSTSTTNDAGYIWIDGNNLHYTNGSSKCYISGDLHESRSLDPGYLWIEGTEVRYTGEDGNIYKKEGGAIS